MQLGAVDVGICQVVDRAGVGYGAVPGAIVDAPPNRHDGTGIKIAGSYDRLNPVGCANRQRLADGDAVRDPDYVVLLLIFAGVRHGCDQRQAHDRPAGGRAPVLPG